MRLNLNQVVKDLKNHSAAEIAQFARDVVSVHQEIINHKTDFKRPYIQKLSIIDEKMHNPNYPEHNECECGHPYNRHFDWYDDYVATGCKYCGCHDFIPKKFSIFPPEYFKNVKINFKNYEKQNRNILGAK